jgi:hypothetical protein
VSAKERIGAYVDAKLFSSRCALVFAQEIPNALVLRDVYLALVGVALPASPDTRGTVAVRNGHVSESWISDRGDGMVMVREPRGFMAGMGETWTHVLAVGLDLHVEVEDGWEDNIADPDRAIFDVRARSAQELERAVSAIVDVAKARGFTLLERT